MKPNLASQSSVFTHRSIARFSNNLVMKTIVGIILLTEWSACRRNTNHQRNQTETIATQPAESANPGKSTNPSKTAKASGDTELAHKVIYADRTSHGYLLLLKRDPSPEAITRPALKKLVEDRLRHKLSPGDLDSLLQLITIEPHTTDLAHEKLKAIEDATTLESATSGLDALPQNTDPIDELAKKLVSRQTPDQVRPHLLGLHIDRLTLGNADDALIHQEILRDPILTRDLSPSNRDSLDARQWIVLLRADYRIADHFLGLRLLQELVSLVATEHQAIIHDPDTLETMEISAFSQKKLAANRLNIADQVAVIPFPDLSGDQDSIRLTTRGMRRFGSVDLELSGLPKNSIMLQRATDFIYGVAKVLSQEADIDPTGLALEVQSILEVAPSDIQEAYGPTRQQPSCPNCKQTVQVHLVERKPVDTDAIEYTVARIVAPRKTSDQSNYDHLAWIETTFFGLFGSPNH